MPNWWAKANNYMKFTTSIRVSCSTAGYLIYIVTVQHWNRKVMLVGLYSTSYLVYNLMSSGDEANRKSSWGNPWKLKTVLYRLEAVHLGTQRCSFEPATVFITLNVPRTLYFFSPTSTTHLGAPPPLPCKQTDRKPTSRLFAKPEVRHYACACRLYAVAWALYHSNIRWGPALCMQKKKERLWAPGQSYDDFIFIRGCGGAHTSFVHNGCNQQSTQNESSL